MTGIAENKFTNETAAIDAIPYVAHGFAKPESDFSVSAVNEDGPYKIVSASLSTFTITEKALETSADILSANGYTPENMHSLFGWHGIDYNDAVPNTIALDAANYFPTI